MCLVALSACSSGMKSTKPMVAPDKGVYKRNGKTSGKEYFSEASYGVKASPRVSTKLTNLPRGGGRDQTGKPYQVRGKWYYPKEVPGYVKVGGASWYGDAFHGRLTANGEVYDMTHLTAAHATMPLPSYARVTNIKNGNSVIVRVNDRGPYADGRIIDLSRKAAEMLDYTHDGVATVKVEYVGRAPLDGMDDRYLMASYRPGKGAIDPSDGMASGTMVAMNGNTPAKREKSELPGAFMENIRSGDGELVELPQNAPIAPVEKKATSLTFGYAGDIANSSVMAFAAVAGSAQAGWKAPSDREYIALGSFASTKRAKRIAGSLSAFGKVEVQNGPHGVTLTLTPRSQSDIDLALRAAWKAGAIDALTVRP
jgi:rare lipoprotein A